MQTVLVLVGSFGWRCLPFLMVQDVGGALYVGMNVQVQYEDTLVLKHKIALLM